MQTRGVCRSVLAEDWPRRIAYACAVRVTKAKAQLRVCALAMCLPLSRMVLGLRSQVLHRRTFLLHARWSYSAGNGNGKDPRKESPAGLGVFRAFTGAGIVEAVRSIPSHKSHVSGVGVCAVSPLLFDSKPAERIQDCPGNVCKTAPAPDSSPPWSSASAKPNARVAWPRRGLDCCFCMPSSHPDPFP